MSLGKARKQQRNDFKKKLKIAQTYHGIKDEQVYTFNNKPDIKGSELKEIFKAKYKWLD